MNRKADAVDPAAGSMAVYRNIVYTSNAGRVQKLDVYVPGGDVPPGGRPVILAIHGGGWRKRTKDDYGARVASAFLSEGFVVVAPNYQLSRKGQPSWPVNLEQVETAVDWIKGRASQYGINPARVVAMGESAGANLAELLGTPPRSDAENNSSGMVSAVSAVVAFSGPSDLNSLYKASPRAGAAAARFLGGTPSQVPDLYSAASPALQERKGGVPMFLVHGAVDDLVPLAQSMEMAAALKQFEIPYQLVVLPGLGHDLDFPVGTPRNLIPQILEFLAGTWKDKESQSLTS
ncbi:alpha/beta hydrolase [Aquisphaera insulae]|uniref:alpha/beta hydrolase n=1 Tax=Aquisphaera insulae TaxID=2712864 RepID=UPI0013E9D857|nr:alpha/beta hydrolase [Aquisphaera insulae]